LNMLAEEVQHRMVRVGQSPHVKPRVGRSAVSLENSNLDLGSAQGSQFRVVQPAARQQRIEQGAGLVEFLLPRMNGSQVRASEQVIGKASMDFLGERLALGDAPLAIA